MKYQLRILCLIAIISYLTTSTTRGQTQQADSLLQQASLQQCIEYALLHRPIVKQSSIDEQIGERDIDAALSGWLPQITGTASYNENIKRQTMAFNGQVTQIGTRYTSLAGVSATQQILNAGLIQASKTAKWYRLQYKQNSENNKISTVIEVSKGFYDILTSREQLRIADENIARIQKQFKDSKAQYDAGLVDKIDYKRAQISLSNSLADKKRITELLKYKYAYLKQLMGYPALANLDLVFNNTNMEKEAMIDTTQQLNYENRIEYKTLQTQKQLQHINTSYNKMAYLPTLSANINYNWNYLNNSFSNLWDTHYPNSVFGVTLSLPIFQGTYRTQQIKKSQLQERRIDLDLLNSKNTIYSQYESALASYKANLNDWRTAKSNIDLSTDVYNTIKLQYNEGVKTYLELMTAETDLRTSQVNYLNSLYSLLSSKLDLEQALGTITF